MGEMGAMDHGSSLFGKLLRFEICIVVLVFSRFNTEIFLDYASEMPDKIEKKPAV